MKKSKIFMIFGIAVLVIAIVGSTLAYYVWNTSSDEETKIVTDVGAATVYFDGGSTIENASIRPVSDKSKGIVKTIGFKGSVSGISANLYLDIINIDTGLKDNTFKYAFYDGSTLIKEGSFTDEYLNSNTELLSYNETDKSLFLNFNENILEDINTNNILEEVSYSINLSIKDNYDVNNVVYYVNDKVIGTFNIK